MIFRNLRLNRGNLLGLIYKKGVHTWNCATTVGGLFRQPRFENSPIPLLGVVGRRRLREDLGLWEPPDVF